MTNWAGLTEELDRWGDTGAKATFWWRDDDAIEATPQLERLLQCALGVPLALAVVPAFADQTLADRLGGCATATVLQHGWRHVSHSDHGKSEYPGSRPDAEVGAEFARGRIRLETLFGCQALPVFAPPWHGFDDRFLALFPDAGIRAISRKDPRPSLWAAPGVHQANAHVSPILWTTPPSFADEFFYIGQFVDHLQARRLGRCDRDEPTGLLTHHLVQNDDSWNFIAKLIEVIEAHPAATWRDARDIFQISGPKGR